MTEPCYRFEGIESLKKRLCQKEQFMLDILIGAGDEYAIKQIVKICLGTPFFKGLCIGVKHDIESYGKLIFFDKNIKMLLSAQKNVLFHDTPPCIIRALLGSYWYMRFRYQQGTLPFRSTKEKTNSECRKCIDKQICHAPELISIGAIKPVIEKEEERTKLTQNELYPFQTQWNYLNQMHAVYVHYCQSQDRTTSYRTVYYVTNIDFDSEHSFENRFIYGCNALNPKDYATEFSFMREHTIARSYVDMLEGIADIEKTSQVAYSLAQKGSRYRESFYMFTPKTYGDKLLMDFQINYRYPHVKDLQFIGIGIDVFDDGLGGYKLYFQTTKHFLSRYLKPYISIEEIDLNIHYLVLRLDREEQFVSYKIELMVAADELEYFKKIIPYYDDVCKKMQKQAYYDVAIEIKEEQIDKINIYHRHYLGNEQPYVC